MTAEERDIRIPAADGTVRCCFRGCVARGLPDEDSDTGLFSCDDCLDMMERYLILESAKRSAGMN